MEGIEQELGSKVTFLVRLKEKKIAAADRQRKLLIKSANQLYDYEAVEIENLYNKAMHDIREDFEKEESKVCGQKRSVSEVDTESKSGHRQLRSAISVSEVASQDNSKSAAITQPKSKRKAISPNISLSSTVDKFIPELSIRSDLLEIVRDMQFQAGTCNIKGQVDVCTSDDYSEIAINGESYLLGEDISVHSVLCNQTFAGTITKMSHTSFVICTSKGLRLRILIEQVQRRRVLISKL